jgi:hypothetical protein
MVGSPESLPDLDRSLVMQVKIEYKVGKDGREV